MGKHRINKKIIFKEFLYFLSLVLFLGTAGAMIGVTAPLPQSHAEGKNLQRDNTGVNKRDTTNHTLTPEDQAKGSVEDVEKTRKIRERLTRDESLSAYAKNVKIITLNGVTTLRGPVKSTEESLFVEKVAKSVSPTVENKLEVVTK